jgi:drug/metabolite transporter (DMT)-like permease
VSARVLRPPERAAAGLLGALVFFPPLLARLDGAERWMLDWFALSAALLFAAATGLRRQSAVPGPGEEEAPAASAKVPGVFRAAVWIARIGAGAFAAAILLQMLLATVERRWDALSAPLVLLALVALFAAVRGVDLLEERAATS